MLFFHIGPGIIPKLPYRPFALAEGRNWSRDIPGPIWKRHLLITYLRSAEKITEAKNRKNLIFFITKVISIVDKDAMTSRHLEPRHTNQ